MNVSTKDIEQEYVCVGKKKKTFFVPIEEDGKPVYVTGQSGHPVVGPDGLKKQAVEKKEFFPVETAAGKTLLCKYQVFKKDPASLKRELKRQHLNKTSKVLTMTEYVKTVAPDLYEAREKVLSLTKQNEAYSQKTQTLEDKLAAASKRVAQLEKKK